MIKHASQKEHRRDNFCFILMPKFSSIIQNATLHHLFLKINSHIILPIHFLHDKTSNELEIFVNFLNEI